ncbi:MAG: ornithine cyclodeaminase family protein [Alphaproteobacteria bacterium]|nr:ornithine cyclodeaminase family protein [Alphaproteobacteria bacterium]
MYFSAASVRERLSYPECIAAVRDAMVRHSKGQTRHLLRSFIALGEGRTFAQMPAALGTDRYFGAKLVSVFADPKAPGRRAHRGVVVLFEGGEGEPVAIADAGAVTLVRTAAASAVATDALARPDSTRLAVLGTGRQAEAHVDALSLVRPFREIVIWGRSRDRAEALAQTLRARHSAAIKAEADARKAVQSADVICTVTSAPEPILFGEWVKRGAHVNLVGSSAPGPAEADTALVAMARFFADCREHVTQHGAEYLRALEAGAVSEGHIAGEIGEVIDGARKGRLTPDDITVYKSLGHAVQDLAATVLLYEQARGAPAS